jgi:hypothetical protein
VLGNESLELRDELRVAAERELGVDELLAADEPELVQALRLERQQAVVSHVGERRAAPERESCAEPVGGEAGGAASERVPSLAEKPLESNRVDPRAVHLEDVPAAAGDHGVLPERGPQARDVDAQRLRGTAWGTALPQLLDEAVADDGPSRLEHEQREQRPLPAAADLEGPAVADGFDRAEQPELESRSGDRRHVLACISPAARIRNCARLVRRRAL